MGQWGGRTKRNTPARGFAYRKKNYEYMRQALSDSDNDSGSDSDSEPTSYEQCIDLDLNVTTEELKGDNQYETSLGNKVDATLTRGTYMMDPHHMVQIHLKRTNYVHGLYSLNRARLNEVLFIELFPIRLSDKKTVMKRYHLVGFTQFRGEVNEQTGQSRGHYIAYVTYDTNYDFRQRQWWKCDDNKITPVSFEDINEIVRGDGNFHTVQLYYALRTLTSNSYFDTRGRKHDGAGGLHTVMRKTYGLKRSSMTLM